MKPKQENPYAYGYARMPRIIRKGYTNLTNMQKLLYIYLRDLCGEEGTCYRSLRSLKEETGFSIGYLSDAIPILHNEGLIHAEMRKTHNTHWEVWHISIIDIWEKNAAFLQAEREKCSPDEQLDNQSVHEMNRSVHQMNRIPESVHVVNESVHTMTLNKNPDEELSITKNPEREGADAPPSREELSPEELSEKVDGAIIGIVAYKIITDKHKAIHVDDKNARIVAPALSLPSKTTSSTYPGSAATGGIPPVPSREPRAPEVSRVQAPVSVPAATPLPIEAGEMPRRARGNVPRPTVYKKATVPKRPAESAPILTPEEQAVIDRWSEAMKRKYPLTESLIKAAKLLAPLDPSVEDLKAVRGFCFVSNPDWFKNTRKGAVTLLDVAKNWEAWQSSQEQAVAPLQDMYTAASLDKDRNQRNIERLKAKAALHGHVL